MTATQRAHHNAQRRLKRSRERRGATTKKNKLMPNTGKKPKWVLFDQLHVDVEIQTTKLNDKGRKDLKNLINSEAFKTLIENVIVGPWRDRIRATVNK